ncbi:hypothetical protein CP061683_1024B, partial [Chlamydia psittaci 06-1683]
VFFISTDI